MTLCQIQDYDLIVLGGGAAGIAAALAALAQGKKPLLIESAKHLGGRTRSYFDHHLQTEIDNGPHILIGACHQTIDLLSSLHTNSPFYPLEALPFWDAQLGFHQLDMPPGPWGLPLLAGLFRFAPLSWPERLAAMRFGLHVLLSRHKIDALSVEEWLASCGQSYNLRHRLWYPLAIAITNEMPDEAASPLLKTVFRRAFFGGKNSSCLLLPKLPLSQLLAEPAHRYIEKLGGKVITSCRVQHCTPTPQSIESIATSKGKIFCQNHPIILALPQQTMVNLFPQWSKTTELSYLRHAPIVTVHVGYSTPITLGPHPLVGWQHPPFPWFFDLRTLHHPQDDRGHIAAIYSGAHREVRMPNDALIHETHTYLAHIHPQLAEKKPIFTRVIKEWRATPSFTTRSLAWRSPPITPWRNLFLAGDWTVSDLPATLENAITSGRRAVAHAFNPLSKPYKNV